MAFGSFPRPAKGLGKWPIQDGNWLLHHGLGTFLIGNLITLTERFILYITSGKTFSLER